MAEVTFKVYDIEPAGFEIDVRVHDQRLDASEKRALEEYTEGNSTAAISFAHMILSLVNQQLNIAYVQDDDLFNTIQDNLTKNKGVTKDGSIHEEG